MDHIDRAIWHTSSYSGNGGNCVEVAIDSADALVLVRDSKDRDGATLTFSGAAWSAFTANLRASGTPAD